MPERIQIRCKYALGDVVVLTAAVRDLFRSYPGKFEISVDSGSCEVWQNNPYVHQRLFPGRIIDCGKAQIDRSGATGRHYVHAYLDLLNEQLGTHAQISEVKGDIHLSRQERRWYSDLWTLCGREVPFWLICPGGKFDIPIKWWAQRRYQEVVDALRGKIQFVQVGHWGNHHPLLEGAIDLRGKTSIRDLIHLVHHADGVLCGVTSLMHLAAAVPLRHAARQTIVIAGNREPASWEAYPGHIYLTAGKDLSCGNCWNRTLASTVKRTGKTGECHRIQNELTECMDAITSEQIVEQFHLLKEMGATRFLSPGMHRLGRKALESAAAANQYDKHNITPGNAVAKADEFLEGLESFPEKRFAGRGVVICAGGLGYFARAWVCIRMLRQLGCSLPIEVWHFGRKELDAKMEGLLSQLNVECVDAKRKMRQVPMRNPFGFELKAYSLVHSEFREVLSLDADNVPIVDPTFLFETPEFTETGAIFWPDYGRLKRSRPIWKYCGVPYQDEPEFESGQMVIDKARCWRALNLAWWYNEHSEFFYQYIHGDKDTFHLGWRRTGTPYSMPSFPIESLDGVMCQHDFQGRRIFQHRNSHKWTYFGENTAVPGFQLEETCLKHLEQLREAWDGTINGRRELQPFRGFGVRTDTLDRHVYESVAMFNEYRLPSALKSHQKVVDVGTHIGSFVRACHERGSREIHGFEPHPDNFRLARRNAGHLPGVHLYHSAVLDQRGFVQCNPPPPGIGMENTGGVTVIPSKDGAVRCVAIDDLLVRLGHVTVLKLDCEGSEWPILLHMKEWRRVGAVCGEYHLCAHPEARTPDELSELLRRRFRFVAVQPDNDQLGKFWGSDIRDFFRNVGTSLQSTTNGRSSVCS